MSDDDMKKWLNPWPLFPQREGGAAGKRQERTMFNAVGNDNWSPRTVVRNLPDGEVTMKTGGGFTSFTLKPNRPAKAPVSALWPLVERDYNERTFFADRATLTDSVTPCIMYAAITSFTMLDVEGREVTFILKDSPHG